VSVGLRRWARGGGRSGEQETQESTSPALVRRARGCEDDISKIHLFCIQVGIQTKSSLFMRTTMETLSKKI
jgi:hypothetical protein